MTDTSPFIGGLRKGATASSHFTIVANLIARDPRLWIADKGLMLCLLSHQEGLRITETFLASQCMDGVKAIRASLDRLRTLGYVYRSLVPLRHPKGTRSKEGKLIGGGIAGYEWWVTDKPDEIAIILDQYAKEQHVETTLEAPNLDEIEHAADPVDNSNLGAVGAAWVDQHKQGVIPGQPKRPLPTVGLGRAIEDQPKKTKEPENQDHAPASGREASSPTEGSHATGPSPAADVGGPDAVTTQHGDQQTARVHELDDPRRRRELADGGGSASVRARRAPSWRESRKTSKKKLDPATRAAVRDEVASRARPPVRAVPDNDLAARADELAARDPR